jgi:hypothetical protein
LKAIRASKARAANSAEQFGEGIFRRPISLTLSAGLAIADVKYPVSFLFTLAEGLLKQAKKLARQRRTSTLCHLWLRAPVISEKADAVLDALYKRNLSSKPSMLTARPYTHEDAESSPTWLSSSRSSSNYTTSHAGRSLRKRRACVA